jgi:hypothetical protein
MVNTNVSALSSLGSPPQLTNTGGSIESAGNVGSPAVAGFQTIFSQAQPADPTASSGNAGASAQSVDAAIVVQANAQAQAGGGANPAVVGPPGYGRGAALDYVAQLQNVITNQSYLPNATGPGLTTLPGTPRNPAPKSTIDDYTRLVAELTAKWNFTPAELAEAGQRLTANLASGVSLDPGTSAAVMLERLQRGVSAAQFAAGASAQLRAAGTDRATGSSASGPAGSPARNGLEATTSPRPRAAAKAKAPTTGQLAAIRARAVAAGHRPSQKQVLATYYRYA